MATSVACTQTPAFELSWTLVDSDVEASSAAQAVPLASAFDCARHGVVRIRVETVRSRGKATGPATLVHAEEFPCFPEQFLNAEHPRVRAERAELRELLGVDEAGEKIRGGDEGTLEHDEDDDTDKRRAREKRLQARLAFLDGLDGRVSGPVIEDPGTYEVRVFGLDRRDQRWKSWRGPELKAGDACLPGLPATDDDAIADEDDDDDETSTGGDAGSDAGTETGTGADTTTGGDATATQATQQGTPGAGGDTNLPELPNTLCAVATFEVKEGYTKPVSLGQLSLRAPHPCEDGVDNDNDGASDAYDPGCQGYEGDPRQIDAFEAKVIDRDIVKLSVSVLGDDPSLPRGIAQQCETYAGVGFAHMLMTVRAHGQDAAQCQDPPVAQTIPLPVCDQATGTVLGDPLVLCRYLKCDELSRNFAAMAPKQGCATISMTGVAAPPEPEAPATAPAALTQTLSVTHEIQVVRPSEFEFAFGYEHMLPELKATWTLGQLNLSYENFRLISDGINDFVVTDDDYPRSDCALGKSNIQSIENVFLRITDGPGDRTPAQDLLIQALTDSSGADELPPVRHPHGWVEFGCRDSAIPAISGFQWTQDLQLEAFAMVRDLASGSVNRCMDALPTPGLATIAVGPGDPGAIRLRRTRVPPALPIDPNAPDALACRECATNRDCSTDACEVATGKCYDL